MVTYSRDWGVVGHAWAVERLARSLANDRQRHAYLIVGPSGIGKTTLALGFAQALNCLADAERPCGKCRACRLIAANKHADVTLISADDKSLKIEQIREMQHTLALRPVEARWRVIILQRFHEATGNANDALLKTLEEPPPYVVMLVTAERLVSVLPTIRSRCQPIPLRPLPAAAIRAELERRQLADGEQALLLAHLAGGSLGWAIQAASDEAILTERSTTLTTLEALLGADRIARFKYAETLTASDSAKSRVPRLLSLWQSYWRDVLLLVSAAHIGITNRDHAHSLTQLAGALHIEDAQRVLSGIQRTVNYIDRNVNMRLALEVLLLDLPIVKLLAAPPS